MTKFLNGWQSFIEKTVLLEKKELIKEFTGQERKEIISQGDNFTISYEFELVSREPINGDGNYISTDDIDNIGPKDQVALFGMRHELSSRAEDINGEVFLEGFFSYRGQTTRPVSKLLLGTIALYLESISQNENLPIKVTTSMVETFILASFLSSTERGIEYNSKITDLLKNDKTYFGLLERLRKIGVQVDSASGLSSDEREVFIGKIMGFGGPDWEISFSGNEKVSPKSVFETIVRPGPNYFINELEILEKACEFVFNGNSGDVTLEDLADAAGMAKQGGPDFAPISGFREFRTGVDALAEKAKRIIEHELRHLIQSFDYRDEGLDLEGLDLDEYDRRTKVVGGNALEDYLPNFWSRYGKDMKTMADGSLPEDHNVEIAMKTYIVGIKNVIEHLDSFFDDFESQDNFSFTRQTGLHTNISMDIVNKKFNILKALFFLNEKEDRGMEPPFAYRGIDSRYDSNEWSAPIKDVIFKKLKQKFTQNSGLAQIINEKYSENNFEEITDIINKAITDSVASLYVKGYGLNLHYINDKGYIEFRYPGHKVGREALKNLTLYYCHVIKAALDPEYKKEEFKVKLIGFLQKMFSAEKINKFPTLKLLASQYKEFIEEKKSGTQPTSPWLPHANRGGNMLSTIDGSIRWEVRSDFILDAGKLEELLESDKALIEQLMKLLNALPTAYRDFSMKNILGPRGLKNISMVYSFFWFIHAKYLEKEDRYLLPSVDRGLLISFLNGLIKVMGDSAVRASRNEPQKVEQGQNINEELRKLEKIFKSEKKIFQDKPLQILASATARAPRKKPI